jgi:hypothetical protein
MTETLNKTQKKIQSLSDVIASASEEFALYKQSKASDSTSSDMDKIWGKSSNSEDLGDPIDELLNHLSNS